MISETLSKQLQLQNELNIKTCGKDWRTGMTKDGKPINWRLCIIKEAEELIDSMPWKHWKDIGHSVTDYRNIHIELVDIWHFILSDLLTSELENSERVNIINSNINSAKQIIIDIPISSQEKNSLIIEKSMDLISEAAITRKSITNTNTIKNFFVLCQYCDLQIHSLFALYFGKNYLNEFRQKNGYKNGTYRKMWAKNREDNTFMYNIILSNNNISKDEIMEEFQKIYKGTSDAAA